MSDEFPTLPRRESLKVHSLAVSGAGLCLFLLLGVTGCVTKKRDDLTAVYTCDSGEKITVHYNGRESAQRA